MSAPWMFWGFGTGLMLVGVLLLGWSILWDRPTKGQKRCPKCWYDLSHPGLASDPLRCSECGYRAKKDKHLTRTRRKWRWAVLGILILGSGMYTSALPKAKRDGWLSFVPDSILILCITSDTNSWAATELQGRLFPPPPPPVLSVPWSNPGAVPLSPTRRPGIMWSWQWRWLAWRLGRTSLRSNRRYARDVHDDLWDGIDLPWIESSMGHLYAELRGDDIDRRNGAAEKLHRILIDTENKRHRVEFVRSLLEIIEAQPLDEQDRSLLGLLDRPWPEMQPAVPGLVAHLDREPIDARRLTAARSLVGIGPYAQTAVKPLLAGLPEGRPDLPIYFLNLEAVCSIDPSNAAAQRILQSYLEDDSIYIGYRFEASEVWSMSELDSRLLLDFWLEVARNHRSLDHALKKQMIRYLDAPDTITVGDGILMLSNRIES